MTKVGIALRGASTFLRSIEFAGAALILGITSYWLAVLHHHHEHIPTWEKAVEGMSGAAVIYTAFGVILTCFLGGITFFAFLAVLLDVLFAGAFIAIAVLLRGGTHSCSGNRPPSPIGPGNRTSCRLEKGAFAVAIAMAVLLLLTAALQVLLSRNHKKEKRFGPGPSNNYTSGTGKKLPFWKRNKKATASRDAELGTFGTTGVGAANVNESTTNKKSPFWKRNKKTEAGLGAAGAGALIAEEKHEHQKNTRPSHDTGITGTTASSPDGAYGGPNNRYGPGPTVPNVNQANYQNPMTGGQNTAYGGESMKNHPAYNAEPAVPAATHSTHHTTTSSALPADESYQSYRQGGDMHAGYVEHDPSPYAEVHNGGFPHIEGFSNQQQSTTTFGSGRYHAT